MSHALPPSIRLPAAGSPPKLPRSGDTPWISRMIPPWTYRVHNVHNRVALVKNHPHFMFLSLLQPVSTRIAELRLGWQDSRLRSSTQSGYCICIPGANNKNGLLSVCLRWSHSIHGRGTRDTRTFESQATSEGSSGTHVKQYSFKSSFDQDATQGG